MSEVPCQPPVEHARPGWPRPGAWCGSRGRSRHAATDTRGGFTLIELLVVMGVIVLLAGGVAMALRGRGGDSAALNSAQKTLGSLLGAARAQAALHQTRTRLAIYAQVPPTPNADGLKYLRSLIVLREDPVDSNRFVAVGDVVTLPTPVCVVPPGPVPTNHLGLPAGQTWNNNVATGPVSTLTQLNSFNYRGQVTATATQFFGVSGQNGRILYLDFQSDGTAVQPTGVPAGTPIKIALTTGVLSTSTTPRFNNAGAVRGLFIRRTGAIAYVNSATGF